MQYYLFFPYERNWIAGSQLISKFPSFCCLSFTKPSTQTTLALRQRISGQDRMLHSRQCASGSTQTWAYDVRDLEDDFQNSKRKIWCRNKTKNMLILKGRTENRIAVVQDMNVIIVALKDTRRDVTNTAPSTKKIQKVDGAETDVSNMRSYSIPDASVASVAGILIFTNLRK